MGLMSTLEFGLKVETGLYKTTDLHKRLRLLHLKIQRL